MPGDSDSTACSRNDASRFSQLITLAPRSAGLPASDAAQPQVITARDHLESLLRCALRSRAHLVPAAKRLRRVLSFLSPDRQGGICLR